MIVLIRIESNGIPLPLDAGGSRGVILLRVELCLNFIGLVYKFHLCYSLVSLLGFLLMFSIVVSCIIFVDVLSNV